MSGSVSSTPRFLEIVVGEEATVVVGFRPLVEKVCLPKMPTRSARCFPLSKNPVGLGFLDLEFHVVVPPQGSALAGIPRRRNLHQLRLAFECLRYVNVELMTKTLGVNTAILLDIGEK